MKRCLLLLMCVLVVSKTHADDQRDSRLATGEEPQRLNEVLTKWATAMGGHESVRTTFQRYEYDHVFLQEKRGEGTMSYQVPDRFELTSGPPSEELPKLSAKKGFKGQHFVVESESAIMWYSDNHEFILVDHESQTFDTIPMPYWMQTTSFSSIEGTHQGTTNSVEKHLQHSLLERPVSWFHFNPRDVFVSVPGTFLCGYDLDATQERFTWTLEKQTEERIQLSGKTEDTVLARNLRQVDVMLDATTHRTTAVRIIDPGGTKSTVYVITALEQNDASLFVRPPDLRGYRNSQTSNREAVPVAESDSESSILPITCAILATVVLLQTL